MRVTSSVDQWTTALHWKKGYVSVLLFEVPFDHVKGGGQ